MKQKPPAAAPTGPVRVCLYLRVSTDKQANMEDGSLDTQLDKLLSFVELKKSMGEGWTVVEKIVEGERDGRRHGRSAKNTDRPGLQKLLGMARAKLVDVVVVTKIDRISRNTVDFLSLVKELDELGVKAVSLRENIDLTTPAGKFQTTIMIALAEQERQTISQRTKEKVEWRAGKGLPLGPPPIGYRMHEKMYVIDEPFAKHVRTCDRIYLEHHSSEAVLRDFRRLGYRTPRGHRYNLPMVCRMLRNPTYAARIEYGGEVHAAQWKPIRPPETHDRIQKIMDANDRRRRRAKRETKEHVYLVQGLLRCGRCEHMMTPKPGIGSNGRYYAYYACSNAEKSLGEACTRKHVPAKTIDRAVIEFLKKLELHPDLVKKFVQKANEMVSETAGRVQGDLERVREQLASVRSKLSNLTDILAEQGKAALASVAGKMEALEAERAELERSEAKLKAEIEAETCQILSAQEQVRSLTLFNQLVELNQHHPERIKAMLPRFVGYVVWNQDEKREGTLSMALFPRPVLKARDVNLKTMLSDLLERRGGPSDRGSEGRCFVHDYQVGSQQELVTKHLPGRTFRAAEDYFTRFDHGRKRFILDEQPGVLRHLETIDQTVWRKYQTFLKRSNPLEQAEFYAQQLSNGRYRSIRALAKALKQDFSSIARHLRLLNLPSPVQEYLREHRTPEIVRYFTERRLRDLVKVREAKAAWRKFQEMLAQARQEAKLWSPFDDPSSPAST